MILKIWKNLFGGESPRTPAARLEEPLIEPLEGHALEKRVTVLCDAYVTMPATFADIRNACRLVEAKHLNHRALATFDNVTQAFYTNGHAVNMYDLDNTEDHNLDGLSPTSFEDGEHIGYFSTKEEFPFRAANFRKQLSKHPAINKTLYWVDANTDMSIAQVNAQPDSLVDQPCIVMAVPVKQPCDTIMAFPNGYFAPDLTPFEVYHLCQALEEKGYALFAIGASYLAFERTEVTQDVSDILGGLYADADLAELRKALMGQSFLILRYTE